MGAFLVIESGKRPQGSADSALRYRFLADSLLG